MVPEFQVAVTPVLFEALLTALATLAPEVPAVNVKLVPLMLNVPGFMITPPGSTEELKVACVPGTIELMVISAWLVMDAPLKVPVKEIP